MNNTRRLKAVANVVTSLPVSVPRAATTKAETLITTSSSHALPARSLSTRLRLSLVAYLDHLPRYYVARYKDPAIHMMT